jgi:hypothetical protein
MGKRTRKPQKTRSPKRASGLNQELTVVAMFDTMDEAKENETLLKNNDIPAMVKQQQDEFSDSKRYAIWVPEDLVDEAHVIIESQDAYDDFYDLAMDDEEEEDLEGDIFEEGS